MPSKTIPTSCILAAGFLLILSLSHATGATVTPTDGMVITSDTTFTPGTYYLKNGITIGASDITLDGNGAILIGTSQLNNGVYASGQNNVTIENLTVRYYWHDFHFYDCDGLTVQGCNAWNTYELPQGSIFLSIFDGPNGSYAHAMWFRYCDDARIFDNDASDQQNGISLFNCTYAVLDGNYCSYNTGWGIYLYDSDYCTVQYNTADYCTRDYYGWSGADAASILIVMQSDNNDVINNSFIGGGDGVFLSGPVRDGEKRPNNNNYFNGNDCSYSPNNGFEGTFSGYNVYENNVSDHCNYGYWLGYAYNNEIRNNQANNCNTAGIAIEHGRNHIIEGNTFNNNDKGIYLWTDADTSLVSQHPEAKDSYGYTIYNNIVQGNTNGIYCLADQSSVSNRYSYDYTITHNTITGNSCGIRFKTTTDSTIHSNIIEDSGTYGILFQSSTANTIYNNRFSNTNNAYDTGGNAWNIAKTPGLNIVNGPYIGGNYWSDYAGDDLDGDGLGDTEVPYKSSGGIQSNGDNRPLLVSQDTDVDGLPDGWEIFHFGDLSHDGDSDDDVGGPDGKTNHDEYVAGTDPLDASSYFGITSIVRTGSPFVVTITWSSVTGKHYAVYYSDDEIGPAMSWTLARDMIAASSTDSTTWTDDGSWTDPDPQDALSRHYRVQVIEE